MIYQVEWTEKTLKRTEVEADSKHEALMWFNDTDQYRVNVITTVISDVKVTVDGEEV